MPEQGQPPLVLLEEGVHCKDYLIKPKNQLEDFMQTNLKMVLSKIVSIYCWDLLIHMNILLKKIV